MGYNLARRYVSCYRCGGRPLPAVVAELAHCDWKAAKKLLDGVEGVSAEMVVERRGRLVLPERLVDLLPAQRAYLRSRDFHPDELSRLWHLRGVDQFAERLRWRIFIPIEYRGECVSWTTRSISPTATLRYISASAEEEKINHKHLLDGEDAVRGHAVVIVEGPFDKFRVGPGCVSLCGTGYSRAQVLRASKYLRRTVCFDSSAEAQRRAAKLADELAVFPGDTQNVMLDAADPGVAKPPEVAQLRRVAGL